MTPILGPIDHIAFVVSDMDTALEMYVHRLGFSVRERRDVPEQRVEIAFLDAQPVAVELIRPLDDESGVARFLQKRGEGQHHVCFRVDDIERALAQLRAAGFQLIDEVPRRGIHGRVAFVHPRSTHGVLIELLEPTHDGGEQER